MSRIELFESDENRYSFRLIGVNEETVLYGKGHSSKRSCLEAITDLKESIRHDSRIIRTNNAWFSFEVTDKDQKTLAKSQSFNSHQKREEGIKWLCKAGNSLPVVEV